MSLRTVVATALVELRLTQRQAPEVDAEMVAAWCRVLERMGIDGPRARVGFERYAEQSVFWPAPAEIARLAPPPVHEPEDWVYVVERPDASPVIVAEGREYIPAPHVVLCRKRDAVASGEEWFESEPDALRAAGLWPGRAHGE